MSQLNVAIDRRRKKRTIEDRLREQKILNPEILAQRLYTPVSPQTSFQSTISSFGCSFIPKDKNYQDTQNSTFIKSNTSSTKRRESTTSSTNQKDGANVHLPSFNTFTESDAFPTSPAFIAPVSKRPLALPSSPWMRGSLQSNRNTLRTSQTLRRSMSPSLRPKSRLESFSPSVSSSQTFESQHLLPLSNQSQKKSSQMRRSVDSLSQAITASTSRSSYQSKEDSYELAPFITPTPQHLSLANPLPPSKSVLYFLSNLPDIRLSASATKRKSFDANSTDGSTDFVYCRVAGCNFDTYNPYELEIVPYNSLESDTFFTASSTGITHYFGDSSEHSTVSEWLRERELFCTISAIPLFASYRRMRCFCEWASFARRRRMMRAHSQLKKMHFIVSSPLHNALFNIMAACNAFKRNNHLFIVDDKKTYRADEFVLQMQQHSDEFRTSFLSLETEVENLIRAACQKVLEEKGFFDSTVAIDAVISDTRQEMVTRSNSRAMLSPALASTAGSSPLLSPFSMGSGEGAGNVLLAMREGKPPPQPGFRSLMQGSMSGSSTPLPMTPASTALLATLTNSRPPSVGSMNGRLPPLGTTNPATPSLQISPAALRAMKAAASKGEPTSYTKLAAKRLEYRRLVSFIRMVDQIMLDLQHHLVVQGTADLLSVLRKRANRPPSILPVTPALDEVKAQQAAKAALTEAARSYQREASGKKNRKRALKSPTAEAGQNFDWDERSRRDRMISPSGESRESEQIYSEADGSVQNEAEMLESLGFYSSSSQLQNSNDTGKESGSESQVKILPPLFQTELTIENGKLELVTDGDQFDIIIKNELAQMIEDVLIHQQYLVSGAFKTYTSFSAKDKNGEEDDDSGSDGGDAGDGEVTSTEEILNERLQNDVLYSKLKLDIDNLHISCFKRVVALATHFRPFLKMLLYNTSLDALEIEQKDPPTTWYSEAMDTHRAQLSDSEMLPETFDEGAFRVVVPRLKQVVSESAKTSINILTKLLPEISSRKRTKTSTEIRSAHLVLTSKPVNVEEFAEYLARVAEIQAEQGTLRHKFDLVEAFYQTIRDNGIEISSEDQANLQLMENSMTQLSSALMLTEGTLEEQTHKFNLELTQQVKEIQQQIKTLRNAATEPSLLLHPEEAEAMLAEVGRLNGEANRIRAETDRCQSFRRLFGASEDDWQELEEVEKEIKGKVMLWNSLCEWKDYVDRVNETALAELDKDNVRVHYAQALKVCAQLDRDLPPNAVSHHLRMLVTTFGSILPIIEALKNEDLKPHHWMKIRDTLTPQMSAWEENFTLGWVLGIGAVEKKAELASISDDASQEAVLTEMLHKIIDKWTNLEVKTKPFRNENYLLVEVDELLREFDDAQVQLETIKGSQHSNPIREQLEFWASRLTTFSCVLDQWLLFQQKWLALEPVFQSDELLKDYAKKFQECDRFWKDFMRRAHEFPNALRATQQPGLEGIFRQHNTTLDHIHVALNGLLNTKRTAFGRFFFLPDDDLLEILKEGKNPAKVMPYLNKLFDNINSLELSSDDTRKLEMTAMISAEGEMVPFGDSKVIPRGKAVEVWMKMVENAMMVSLHLLLKAGVKKLFSIASTAAASRLSSPFASAGVATNPRQQWILNNKAQIVIAGSQILWASQVEQALNSEKPAEQLAKMMEKCETTLELLTDLARGKLNPQQRTSVGALIVVEVHARDIVEELIRDGVSSASDFDWQKRLRYYWDAKEDDCVIRQTTSSFKYGYEYLGCTSRLVITPLTDQCYITLTSALHLKLGGAPAGPAGTGKTETCKDLSKAVARQCVVFNCSDGLNVSTMAQMFSGMCQAGAWFCFDEFNRIDIEVLSVVAQQIREIQSAQQAHSLTFMFQGTKIPLNKNCAIFITMNPGYAGRTELPDNLKSLFRPVSMMIPDYALIAEIMLFSEGFRSAKPLSRKMTLLYRLSSEQLSQQKHYDFGMRAVKSVLVMAGKLRRENTDLPEDIVLIRAMRESNLPKFLAEDIPLFEAIVGDLFPDALIPQRSDGELLNMLRIVCEERGLQPLSNQFHKTMELFDTFCVRHGVMLVGPTRGGKTVCRDILAEALTRLREESNSANPHFQTIIQKQMNPKSISVDEMFGCFSELTQEWKEGLLSYFVTGAVMDDTPRQKWIIFDGPVDTLWVESLNTVLDDSKILCLPNRKRIKLTSTISLLFEVENLDVASPATVSRCGMIYIDPLGLPWIALVRSWAGALPSNVWTTRLKEYVISLFEQWMPALLDGVAKLKEDIVQPVITKVTNVTRLMEAILTPSNDFSPGLLSRPPSISNLLELTDSSQSNTSRVRTDWEAWIRCVFLFAAVWGVGGSLVEASRDAFDELVRKTIEGVMIPSVDSVFDISLDFAQKTLCNWNIPAFSAPKDTPFFSLLVPTIDTVRFSFLTQLFIDIRKPVLITGDTGVGKSVIIQGMFTDSSDKDNSNEHDEIEKGEDNSIGNSASSSASSSQSSSKKKTLAKITSQAGFGELPEHLSRNQLNPVTIAFTAQTNSNRTQMMIEGKLQNRRDHYSSAPGTLTVLVLEDFNMPSPDTFGSQPPLELIRQLLGTGGWYDRTLLQFRPIKATTTIAACGPPGGGRNAVSQRLTALFTQLRVPQPSEKSLFSIFSSILDRHMEDHSFVAAIRDLVPSIVRATVDLYNFALSELRPTPSKSHYVFNVRDLSQVIQGITNSTPQTVADESAFQRLWCHESLRIFADRLVNKDDRTLLTTRICELAKQYFHQQWSHQELFDSGGAKMWADWLEIDKDPPRPYEEVTDIKKAQAVLENSLAEYNSECIMKKMKESNLVFFTDAIEHIARITRILHHTRGHALLVGVGGCGKQSLTRLAAFISRCVCFEIAPSNHYGQNEFHEDLRRLYTIAGVEGKSTVFLLNDTQLVDDSFLEDINCILGGSDIPYLFDAQNKDAVIKKFRSTAASAAASGRETIKVPDSPDAALKCILDRARDRLHIVLCMSPVGDAFRTRCRMFPSLVNCCTIDWISNWPKQALRSVALKFLNNTPLGTDPVAVAAAVNAEKEKEKEKEKMKAGKENGNDSSLTPHNSSGNEAESVGGQSNRPVQIEIPIQTEEYIPLHKRRGLAPLHERVASVFVTIHASAEEASDIFYAQTKRKIYSTPALFLEMVGLFATLLKEKTDSLIEIKGKYEGGLKTLMKTRESVASMQEELVKMEPMLVKQKGQIAELMQTIGLEREKTEDVRVKVRQEEAVVKEEQEKAQVLKDDAQQDLDKITPVFEAATQALESLSKAAVNEVRTFANPPEAVKKVMFAVCTLFGKKNDWDSARALLAQPNFVQMLLNFDINEIDAAMGKRMQTTFLDDPDFNPEKVVAVSKAAANICAWVVAIIEFARVSKIIEPKKQAAAEAQAKLDDLTAKLDEKRKQLKELEEALNLLEARFDEKKKEQMQTEAAIAQTQNRFSNAERLLDALGDEGERWEQKLKDLSASSVYILGSSIISAACLAYIGPFDTQRRKELIKRWTYECEMQSLPAMASENEDDEAVEYVGNEDDAESLTKQEESPMFSLEDSLSSAVETRDWMIQGLPSDLLSLQNGVITNKTRKWPLMIDPQSQANRWIRAKERGKLKVLRMGEVNFMRTLSNAIRFGQPVLLEDVGESLDPILAPLLRQQTTKQGGRTIIHLNDQDIDVHPNFKLFITTKLSNPHYLPEMFINTTIINFTVTQDGLEEQLLARVVAHEKEEVEEAKDKLVRDMAADAKLLTETEDQILELMKEATVEKLLDDPALILTLDQSKKTSTEISLRVKESQQTEIQLQAARNEYRPMAVRGAVLYFAIVDLALLDPMYQYSLQYFVSIFRLAMNEAQHSSKLSVRLTALKDTLTELIYSNVCRGLFEKHRILFSFFITIQIKRKEGIINDTEWSVFLRGVNSLPQQEPAFSPLAATPLLTVKKSRRMIPYSDVIEPKCWADLGIMEDRWDDLWRGITQSIADDSEGEVNSVYEDTSADDTERSVTADGIFKPTASTASLLLSNASVHTEFVNSDSQFSLNTNFRPTSWTTFIEAAVPVASQLPSPWQEKLNSFQRLLLVRVLLPHRLTNCITHYVKEELGEFFSQSPPLDLDRAHRDSTSGTPIIFILSTGADPTQHVVRFAQSRGFENRLRLLSLGQGQGPIALRLLQNAREKGEWVFLQNCHLAASWMPELERVCLSYALSDTSSSSSQQNTDVDSPANFRLWLSAMPTSAFPVSVLQNGIKLTNEPPAGVRANMLRSLASLNSTGNGRLFETGCTGKRGFGWRRLLIGLTFFHALVQERKKYGALGWNIQYEFNESDYEISMNHLRMYLNEQSSSGEIPWKALRYMTGSVNYGGRVTDEWDRRTLLALLSKFYQPSIVVPGKQFDLVEEAPFEAEIAIEISSSSSASASSSALLVKHPHHNLTSVPSAGSTSGLRSPHRTHRPSVDEDAPEDSSLASKRSQEGTPSSFELPPSSNPYTLPSDIKVLPHLYAFVENFPTSDEPELFGMHINAEQAYQLIETERLVKSLLLMMPNVSAEPTDNSNNSVYSVQTPVIKKHVSQYTSSATLPASASTASGVPRTATPCLLQVPSLQPSPLLDQMSTAGANSTASVSIAPLTPSDSSKLQRGATTSRTTFIPRQFKKKYNPDEDVLNKTRDILAKLPHLLTHDEAAEGVLPPPVQSISSGINLATSSAPASPSEADQPNSLSIILSQEMDRFNSLLSLIKSTLTELQRAIGGFVVMSKQLDEIYSAIRLSEVPALWSASAYPSLRLLSQWIDDLIARVAFFRNWLQNGVPTVFWLPGFFFPQGFLTAVMQTTARKLHCPIDTLHFIHRVMDDSPDDEKRKEGESEEDKYIDEGGMKRVLSKKKRYSRKNEDTRLLKDGPADGVYVSGLFIEGARWDKERMQLAEGLRGEMSSAMPIIHFLPQQEQHSGTPNLSPCSTSASMQTYIAPLYKTAQRYGVLSTTGHSTNFITPVSLPSALRPNHWVLRGVALLCEPRPQTME
ncbi:dynein haevy chain 9, inner dynein arm 5 [Monocercomonoides exilis]|uniref:dynein haevy chain 9, inner dynein arm 5 n=1 Tax=Monocercomonoides exilis TaxID=2049356 RepID=UPI00355941FE|nr:dynein haevy chain 9, inner dynein arm 5 [Monocercomonoides exilis]|eukprot:MONOS_6396.1-p1 / transcript=MONOS_6396.1 / gene=MONOS_6396 / organism=Monocercomonoides_exilis_PA203 / gene_product=dynein haevy chain 9, inner dynein arm 5 / transcript_product=dynein haevy chain 9, inner dynein arm 5 / location=Mono_scaffold00201:5533-20502(+) / protein_length=4971 / sequence_SO=supercontig / SO=protein_coding / is_pseudo=false